MSKRSSQPNKITLGDGFPFKVRFADGGFAVIKTPKELMALSGKKFQVVEKDENESLDVDIPDSIDYKDAMWRKDVFAIEIAGVDKKRDAPNVALMCVNYRNEYVVVSQEWFDRYGARLRHGRGFLVDHGNGHFTLSAAMQFKLSFTRMANPDHVPAQVTHEQPEPEAEPVQTPELEPEAVQESNHAVETGQETVVPTYEEVFGTPDDSPVNEVASEEDSVCVSEEDTTSPTESGTIVDEDDDTVVIRENVISMEHDDAPPKKFTTALSRDTVGVESSTPRLLSEEKRRELIRKFGRSQ